MGIIVSIIVSYGQLSIQKSMRLVPVARRCVSALRTDEVGVLGFCLAEC